MSLESSANKPKKMDYNASGIVIGVGNAWLLFELGLDIEMSVGFGFGLAIGAHIDKRKTEKRV